MERPAHRGRTHANAGSCRVLLDELLDGVLAVLGNDLAKRLEVPVLDEFVGATPLLRRRQAVLARPPQPPADRCRGYPEQRDRVVVAEPVLLDATHDALT